MKYVTHPLIRPESLEERRYQLTIALRALDGNTMVVLPTGLGKTAVALLVAASRLHNEGGRVLVLAPTKPLVEQHLRFFERLMALPGTGPDQPSPFVMFTGETPPEERAEGWRSARVAFATPQAVKNDLIAGRYPLQDVTLLVVDECHRAVGNYAYVFIAERYLKEAKKPLILAMTASPGGVREKIQKVCGHLAIGHVETRVETDEDVRPYVHEREIQYVSVQLPAPLARAVETLQQQLGSRLRYLTGLGFPVPKPDALTIRSLNELNARIQDRIRHHDRTAYQAASVYAEIMKLRHAIALAESQGSGALQRYLEKLAVEGEGTAASKASRRLSQDPHFRTLVQTAGEWTEELHPKLGIAGSLVRAQMGAYPDSRIIIFATYRDTVQLIVDHLKALGIPAERFVGQATKDAEKGLSQKQQIDALRRFREGEFRVLIATSVGEEGLDVPSTDMVIFYEAVPSEIRSIQRKGRTGRHGAGKIIVLVTKGTSDEAYRWVSQAKERAMLAGMKTLASRLPRPPAAPAAPRGQLAIDAFVATGPEITVDDRETSSRVVEALSRAGARISLRRLEQGDYAIGDRVLVERKTSRDFMDTLVERDLFGQVQALASSAPRPVLIVEGPDLYSVRNVNPNAVRGALAAIAVDLGVSVFFTRDEEDTAEMILTLSRREDGEPGERKLHPHKSYRSAKEQQEYILASFPSVGPRGARLLLSRFGSLAAVLSADEAALREVKGIGEKTARAIAEILRTPYR